MKHAKTKENNDYFSTSGLSWSGGRV